MKNLIHHVLVDTAFSIRVFLLFLVFVFSAVYFFNQFNQMKTNTQAAAEPVRVLFDRQEVSTAANDLLQINVYLAAGTGKTISAASIVVEYPSGILDYIPLPPDQAEASCINSGFRLTTVLKEVNDVQKGVLTIARGAIEKSDRLPSDTMCFGTLQFRPKDGISRPVDGTLRFQAANTQNGWEVVGPQNTFVPQYDATKGVIVRIADAASWSEDTTAPVVTIISPARNSTVARKSKVTISAHVQDDREVARVEFLVNGSRVCAVTAQPYSCQWNTAAKPNSSYTIEAVAYDRAGNKGSDRIAVTSK